MKNEDLDFFKKVLNDQLEILMRQAGVTVRSLLDNNDKLPDDIDQATFESERGLMLRIRDRESKLIRKIHKALEDLKSGHYGICESCGEEIALERLKVRPVASHCIRCKTQMEVLER